MSKVTVGLWVPLQAKPGKEAEVEEFLEAGQALVEEEPGTTAWFAVQMGPGTSGSSMSSQTTKAVRPIDAPQIHPIDVLAEKL